MLPDGSTPPAVAVFWIDPASRSAWVTLWWAVQVVRTDGARTFSAHTGAPAPVNIGSAMARPWMVRLPSLVTANV